MTPTNLTTILERAEKLANAARRPWQVCRGITSRSAMLCTCSLCPRHRSPWETPGHVLHVGPRAAASLARRGLPPWAPLHAWKGTRSPPHLWLPRSIHSPRLALSRTRSPFTICHSAAKQPEEVREMVPDSVPWNAGLQSVPGRACHLAGTTHVVILRPHSSPTSWVLLPFPSHG